MFRSHFYEIEMYILADAPIGNIVTITLPYLDEPRELFGVKINH